MRDPLHVFRQLGIKLNRYVLSSNPWSVPGAGMMELCCTECRDDNLPLVVGQWERIAFLDIIICMNRHEKGVHPNESAALKQAA